MKKIIFLDRDGVVNRERSDYTFNPNDFEILEDLTQCLLEWKKAGFEFIIISNQGGIGKKLYEEKDVYALHVILTQELKKSNVEILDFFFCPHHPDYNGKCLCRKPDSLLFERAIYRHGIDVTLSYMIGDKDRDLIPAEKLGIKPIKVAANESLKKLVSLIR